MTRWPLLARRRISTACAVVAIAAGSGVAVPAGPAAATTPATARATAPVGKHDKLSPRLALLSGRPSFASPRALSVPASGVGSLVRRRDGRVLVEIRTADTSTAGVTVLRKLGARVVNVSATYETVTATVAPSALRAIADDANVRYVSEVLAPHVGRATSMARAAGSVTAATTCAPIVSEGDSLMKVAAGRTHKHINGAGQTIGILSDSFNTDANAATHAAGDVAHGELPGAGNPCGHPSPVIVQSDFLAGGQTDEGRAMAQLTHDLAPGARLAFATANNGELSFAAQINKLRTVNHATVIVDDISYLGEPFFQDGPIANAANAASAAGVPYFSAAGNSNVIVGGKNVSSYEAPLFRSVSCPAGVGAIEPTLGCHNFTTTGGTDTGDDITLAPGGSFVLDLQWAQPLGGVTADYDVFVVNAGGTVVNGSAEDNLASQRPFEAFGYKNTTASPQTIRIVIAKYAGPDVRTKFVLLGSAGITAVQYNASTGGDIVGPSIFGHNGASTVGSTAAIPFDNSARSENFSSRGPVTLYFQPSPSTTALGAPQVLAQPSFAATDGVRTSFFAQQIGGVWRFYGTSAAAPQAAAIGALLQEHDPALTPAQLISTLADTARPVATNGTPDAVGGGYLDADAALASVVALPGAPHLVTASSGNGQATVQWSRAATNPNFPLTNNVITPVLSGVPQSGQTFAGTASSAVVTGLTNGGSYTFTVTAANAHGSGPPSAPSAAITVGAPGRPTSVVASPGDGEATLTWNAPNANGSPITDYTITPSIGGVAQSPQTFNSPATTETITGLTNSTSATFTVAAVNANGTGSSSTASPAITVGTPVAPDRPTLSPLAGGLAVGWAPPATSNGAPLLAYIVTVYLNGTSPISTKQVSPGTVSTSVGGLTNGKTYAVTVRATNARGNGPQSALSPKVIAGSPVAPTAVTATPGNGTATVSWQASVGNGAGVTRYTVTPYTGGVPHSPRVFNDTATSHVITGLTNGLSYQFSVAGTNSRGLGPQSTLTPARVIGAPLAPTAQTAVPGDVSASVHWTAPTVNNGAGITGYVITPFIAGVAQTPQTYNSTATTETVTGLTNATSYQFRIAAVNARGVGVNSGATAAITVGAPRAPTGVTAAPAGSHAVTVQWTAPADNGDAITGYIVTPYLGTVAQAAHPFNSTATSQTIAGLTTGQKYTFKVSATNTRGTGPKSAASNAVTVT